MYIATQDPQEDQQHLLMRDFLLQIKILSIYLCVYIKLLPTVSRVLQARALIVVMPPVVSLCTHYYMHKIIILRLSWTT